MAYFEYLSDKAGSPRFETTMSLSQLASYLCVDRTGMMRELKNMCAAGLIRRDGREITSIK